MFLLIAYLALWNISSSAVIRKARSPKQDWDEWLKTLPTLPPIDWSKISIPDTDEQTTLMVTPRNISKWWENLPTLPPVDWSKFSVPDIDERQFNNYYYRANRYHHPDPDDNFYQVEYINIPSKVVVFLPVAFGMALLLVCKHFFCSGGIQPEISTPVLQPSPSFTRFEFVNLQNTSLTEGNPEEPPPFSTVVNVNPADNNNGSTSNLSPTDNPPGYTDVAMSDLLKQKQTILPELVPTVVPDAPPPSYDAEIVKY